jgi:putative membrane protein insertion efficiency factor
MEDRSGTGLGRPDLAGDEITPPLHVSVLAFVLVRVFDLYHLLIAPFLSAHSGSSCRFEPSCSRYARTALLRFGVCRGAYLTMRRVARCHPLGGHGYDPVPQTPAPTKTGFDRFHIRSGFHIR